MTAFGRGIAAMSGRSAALAGAVLGLSLSLGVGAAYAATDTSPLKYFTTNGVGYNNASTITATGSYTKLGARVYRNTGSGGANSMGVKARLYRTNNGELCFSTTTSFNSSLAAGHITEYSLPPCHNSIFYSKGASETRQANGGYEFNSTHPTTDYYFPPA
jgi:hypothetical protein